jgi:hypothetical protein
MVSPVRIRVPPLDKVLQNARKMKPRFANELRLGSSATAIGLASIVEDLGCLGTAGIQ